MIVQYPIKTSTKEFCDTIATRIARYEKYRCWASKHCCPWHSRMIQESKPQRTASLQCWGGSKTWWPKSHDATCDTDTDSNHCEAKSSDTRVFQPCSGGAILEVVWKGNLLCFLSRTWGTSICSESVSGVFLEFLWNFIWKFPLIVRVHRKGPMQKF